MSESPSVSVNGRLGSACPANSLRQEIRNESHAASSSGSLASVSFVLRRVPPCDLSVSIGDFSLSRTTLRKRRRCEWKDQLEASRSISRLLASFVDFSFYFFFLFSFFFFFFFLTRRISLRSPHFCHARFFLYLNLPLHRLSLFLC